MDNLTRELGEALDMLLSTVMHPREFTVSEADHRSWVAMKALRKYHDALREEREKVQHGVCQDNYEGEDE